MAENVHIARVKYLWKNYGGWLLGFAYLVCLFVSGYRHIRQSYDKGYEVVTNLVVNIEPYAP